MKNMLLIALGVKIRTARKLRNLSQESLAHESGIDYSYLGRIERGENNPSYLVLCSLANSLSTNLNELLTAEHPNQKQQARKAA
jgi:transcriptional regulator with XRE-family HTH domain